MTPRTTTLWRNAAGTGAICLAVAALGSVFWYRATYHTWPGMMPTVVHWCGRDFASGNGARTWAQITKAEAPRKVRAVGSYPPLFPARTLLAAPSAGPVQPGEPCAMAVYIRTGPDRYGVYSLEGGP
ncbi:MAG TPA: hypothetical protein VGY50_08005 [Streptosporangiaceae bacterium]|nr:hypothetical protein [Streptosporangiaceae bacterium]